MTVKLLKSAFCTTLALASVQGCSAASSSNSLTNKLSGYVSKLEQSEGKIIEIKGMCIDPTYLVYMLAYNKALCETSRAYDVQHYLTKGETRVIGRDDPCKKGHPSFEDCIVFSDTLYDALSKTLFMYPLASKKLEIIKRSTQRHQLNNQTIHVEPIKPSVRSESLGFRRTQSFTNIAKHFSVN